MCYAASPQKHVAVELCGSNAMHGLSQVQVLCDDGEQLEVGLHLREALGRPCSWLRAGLPGQPQRSGYRARPQQLHHVSNDSSNSMLQIWLCSLVGCLGMPHTQFNGRLPVPACDF